MTARKIAFATAAAGILLLGFTYELTKAYTTPFVWLLAIGPAMYGLYRLGVRLGRRFGRRTPDDDD